MAEQRETEPKCPMTECVIHCSDDNSKLVAPANIESWNMLLRAAKIRGYSPILDLAKNLPKGSIHQLFYHRKCRSIFTMKKLLDSIVAKESSSGNSLAEGSRDIARREPQPSRVYEAKCIFCDKVSKYLKGQRTKESLTKCRVKSRWYHQESSDQEKGYNFVSHRQSWASGSWSSHYHRTCYRAYTKDLEKDTDESNMDEIESPYEAAEKMALSKVFAYIREELIEHHTVVAFTDLTTILVTEMAVWWCNTGDTLNKETLTPQGWSWIWSIFTYHTKWHRKAVGIPWQFENGWTCKSFPGT